MSTALHALDDNPTLRILAAQDETTPAAVLLALGFDEHEGVARAARSNPSHPGRTECADCGVFASEDSHPLDQDGWTVIVDLGIRYFCPTCSPSDGDEWEEVTSWAE